MKHFLYHFLLPLLILNSCSSAAVRAQRIAVFSDLHLLAPELVWSEGKAINTIEETDAKLVRQSDALMTYLTDSLLQTHPDLVLICGDLTFNGERASHLRLVEHLKRLTNAGIAVCVVPGNHDIMDPYARAFDGNRTVDADTLSSNDFAELYAPFGYATALRDSLSLSYAVEPLPGLVIIGLDSNRYTENLLLRRGDERNENKTAGRLREETLQWACERAAEATRQHKTVIALMHHHLIEHFDGEEAFLPRYIIPDGEAAATALAMAGVRIIFTGHLHITDAATFLPSRSDENIFIADVATGSVSTYPFPVRFATLQADGQLCLETRFLQPPADLLAAGQSKLEAGVNTLAGMIANRIWDRFGKQIADARDLYGLLGGDDSRLPVNSRQLQEFLLRGMHDSLLRSMLAVTRGNEPENEPQLVDQLQQTAVQVLAAVLPGGSTTAAEEIVHQLWPRVEPLVASLFRDLNHAGFNNQSRTDDHRFNLQISPDRSALHPNE